MLAMQAWGHKFRFQTPMYKKKINVATRVYSPCAGEADRMISRPWWSASLAGSASSRFSKRLCLEKNKVNSDWGRHPMSTSSFYMQVHTHTHEHLHPCVPTHIQNMNAHAHEYHIQKYMKTFKMLNEGPPGLAIKRTTNSTIYNKAMPRGVSTRQIILLLLPSFGNTSQLPVPDVPLVIISIHPLWSPLW